MLYDRGYRITELPVDHRERVGGSSKYGIRRILRGFVDLLFHIFWSRYSTRPLHLLGGIGLVGVVVGTVLGVHMLILKFVLGDTLTPHVPRLVLIVGLILTGIQLFTFGIIAEFLTKLYHHEKQPYHIEEIFKG
jgi:ABC-type multidrug transport system permease subunit